MRQLKQKDIKSLRKHILKKQNGKCWICGKEPKIPVLDHHHKKKIKGTGQIRGVLCNNCNVFIAKIENNCVRYAINQKDLPTILRKTAEYFEKKQYPYLHPSEKPKDKMLKKTSINKLVKLYSEKYPNRKIPPILIYKQKKTKRGVMKTKEKKLNIGLEKLFKEFNIISEFKK